MELVVEGMSLIKHLLSRHFDCSRYKNITVDEKEHLLTVHLYNLSGQMVGWQQYNYLTQNKACNNPKESRYYTYLPRGTQCAWGYEILDRNKEIVFVVEGIFKASTLHMLGHNALAVLTSNPKHMKEQLKLLPHKLIGIGDSDKAGG